MQDIQKSGCVIQNTREPHCIPNLMAHPRLGKEDNVQFTKKKYESLTRVGLINIYNSQMGLTEPKRLNVPIAQRMLEPTNRKYVVWYMPVTNPKCTTWSKRFQDNLCFACKVAPLHSCKCCDSFGALGYNMLSQLAS